MSVWHRVYGAGTAALLILTAVLLVSAPALAARTSHKAVPAAKEKPAEKSATVRDIQVEGNERIERATILTYADLKPGDPLTPETATRALKNLFATGLFADVTVREQGATLILHVAENPIINEIRFEGNDKIKSEDLQGELQLKSRQVFTRTRVQADVERLQAIYRASGRFSAAIEPKIIKLDQNRVNLIFEIKEGEPTYISRISFIGNRHYSDDQLQKTIRSREERWYRFWTSDDKYDPDRLGYDRELLRKFYLDHGYVDFRVETATAELSPDRRDFFITFVLSEGERYRVGKVEVETAIPQLVAARLKDSLTFKTGEWYKASAIENTVAKLTDVLGNMQFAFVVISPAVTRNKAEHTVDVKFVVKEGPKSFVENININGNSRTLDSVIRREMKLLEGDAFNAAKLKKSEQAVNDLDYFKKAEVKTQPGSTPDKVNIDVRVEEKSTGELSIGGGYSTTDGVLADFRIREKNFLGHGQDVTLATTLAAKRTEFDFSFTEPYFLKRDLSAGIDLFHITRDLQDQSSYDSKQKGGALRLGYPLSEKWRQGLSYRYQEDNIGNVQSNASTFIKQQAGRRTSSIVAQVLTYDTRDSKIEPTEGVLGRFNFDVSGLGGESHYIRPRLGANYYHPIADKWVLSLLGEVGVVAGWAGRDVRINERFSLGGDTLRGFHDAGVGPRDVATSDSLGGNRFWRSSAEVEFPSGLPEDLGVKAHVFSDAGALWSLDSSGTNIQDSSRPRLSLGAGISWRSPFGPIRADIGVPVLKESYDDVQQFRFSFGTRF